MHMQLTIEQAIERARKKQSLEGVVAEHLLQG